MKKKNTLIKINRVLCNRALVFIYFTQFLHDHDMCVVWEEQSVSTYILVLNILEVKQAFCPPLPRGPAQFPRMTLPAGPCCRLPLPKAASFHPRQKGEFHWYTTFSNVKNRKPLVWPKKFCFFFGINVHNLLHESCYLWLISTSSIYNAFVINPDKCQPLLCIFFFSNRYIKFRSIRAYHSSFIYKEHSCNKYF